MLAQWYPGHYFAHGKTWLAVGVGLAVAVLVYVVLSGLKARRRQLAFSSGDLPWEDLRELLLARHHEVAASGSAQENLPPDELLALLMSRLPAKRRRSEPEVPPEERDRRWGTPTAVSLTSPRSSDPPHEKTSPDVGDSTICLTSTHSSDPLHGRPLHGMVINGSAGGFAILVDREVEPATILTVRPLEAPSYIPSVDIEVKHCRKVRRKFLIGCQSFTEVPWNVLAWFG